MSHEAPGAEQAVGLGRKLIASGAALGLVVTGAVVAGEAPADANLPSTVVTLECDGTVPQHYRVTNNNPNVDENGLPVFISYALSVGGEPRGLVFPPEGATATYDLTAADEDKQAEFTISKLDLDSGQPVQFGEYSEEIDCAPDPTTTTEEPTTTTEAVTTTTAATTTTEQATTTTEQATTTTEQQTTTTEGTTTTTEEEATTTTEQATTTTEQATTTTEQQTTTTEGTTTTTEEEATTTTEDGSTTTEGTGLIPPISITVPETTQQKQPKTPAAAPPATAIKGSGSYTG